MKRYRELSFAIVVKTINFLFSKSLSVCLNGTERLDSKLWPNITHIWTTHGHRHKSYHYVKSMGRHAAGRIQIIASYTTHRNKTLISRECRNSVVSSHIYTIIGTCAPCRAAYQLTALPANLRLVIIISFTVAMFSSGHWENEHFLIFAQSHFIFFSTASHFIV